MHLMLPSHCMPSVEHTEAAQTQIFLFVVIGILHEDCIHPDLV